MKTMAVEGVDVDIIDGYVSVDALCKALNIGSGRQKEKCAVKYGIKRMKMPVYYATYTSMRQQVVISEADALDFITSRGIWKHGPYNK